VPLAAVEAPSNGGPGDGPAAQRAAAEGVAAKPATGERAA